MRRALALAGAHPSPHAPVADRARQYHSADAAVGNDAALHNASTKRIIRRITTSYTQPSAIEPHLFIRARNFRLLWMKRPSSRPPVSARDFYVILRMLDLIFEHWGKPRALDKQAISHYDGRARQSAPTADARNHRHHCSDYRS